VEISLEWMLCIASYATCCIKDSATTYGWASSPYLLCPAGV
jgi:hypothetical protein